MARDMDIFFSLADGEAAARKLLGEVLALSFPDAGSIDSPPTIEVAGFSFVFIVDHDLEDVPGIAFSEYRYSLSIVPTYRSLASGHDAQLALARYVRDVLLARGVRCMAVDNLQRVLDVSGS